MPNTYTFEILSWSGGVFARSARPWTLEQIKADTALPGIFGKYPHRAWRDGEEVEHLPEFPQASRPEPSD